MIILYVGWKASAEQRDGNTDLRGRAALLFFILFFILFTLLGAIGALGDRGRFVDDPPSGLDKAVISTGKGIRSALGLKEGGPLFGFTKSNELFVGRLAQLGIVFSLIGEIEAGYS
ncbi:hypothetical protein KSP40_PGU006262 [Platanthera guangdongensis]|uniref:Uncharacterized protein n=1 Tax=Platanthera guangdongensis TaxID=2320717 RepID=A0ABR2M7K2_9ASPA